jgi:integrase/recombinase XerD
VSIEPSEGHCPGGRHAAYRVLKTFLRWYDDEVEPEGWRNPIDKVKAPKLEEEPLDPVELQTVNAMTAVCDKSFLGRRDRAILLFLLDTGLRARELLSMNINDINFITGMVRLLAGKGRKPRDVVISKDTRKTVRAYLKLRQDNLTALFVLEDQTDRLGYGGLRLIFERRAKQANVEEPTAHDFRRAFAITMLRNGCDLITLSRLMGHASLKVLRRYLKELPDDLQEAHRKASPVDRWHL